MRIDKYLKVARIIKRRTVAKELALNGRLLVNDRIAKAAQEIKVGDEIKILFGHRTLEIRVEEIREYVHKEESYQLYSVLATQEIKKD